MKQLLFLLLSFFSLSLLAQSQRTLGELKPIPRGFSVYLLKESASKNKKENHKLPGEIFYTYGKNKPVPLSISPGRQTILYPIGQQSSIHLFTGTGDNVSTIANIPVPAAATRGIVILIPSKSGFQHKQFWVTPDERNGSATIQNLLNEKVIFSINGSKKMKALAPNKKTTIRGDFVKQESHACMDTAFYKYRTRKKKQTLQKISELVLHVRKKRHALIFLLPQARNQVKALTLVDDGQINYAHQRELIKYLPAFAKRKEKSATGDGENSGPSNLQ